MAVAGIAAAGLLGLGREAPIDFGASTSAIPQPGLHRSPSPGGDGTSKTDRFAAQLVMPVQAKASDAGPASLVVSPQPSISGPQAEPALQMAQALPQGAALTAAPANAPVVDESALRYFATRGDSARLQAEISRLRALYPTWSPPADPLAGRSSGDPQLEGMWQIYAQGRYADVRKAIADRQAAEPQWQPPEDLLDRLKLAEARVALTQASDRKSYADVIRMAADNPGLLTCSEVDVLWRLAEAFARTDKPERASDAYLYVLNNCDGAAERVATVQKASELLPAGMIEALLTKERTLADGTREFESLRDDLARRFVADANSDPKRTVSTEYLTRLEQVADRQGLAPDALLLGWYNYGHANLGAAERWFRRAFTKEETAAAAEGLALTLTKQHSPAEAESVLYKWRDETDDTRAAYLAAVANLLALDPPPVLQQDVLARMAPVVLRGRNADAAQQFGWYARAMRQPKTAAEWFATVLNWKPDDEPSAYGLALSRFDLNDRPGLAILQRNWTGRSERIAEVGRPTQPQAALMQTGQMQTGQMQTGQMQTGQMQSGQMQMQPRQVQMVQQARPAVTTPMPSVRPVAAANPQPRMPVRSRNAAAPLYVQQQSAPRAPRRVTASAASPKGCALDTGLQSGTPEQALSRGWCLMDLNRPLEAVKAFEAAGESTSQAARSDAAYGRSLAYLRVGLPDKAAVAAAATRQNNTRAVELQSAILADRAINAFKLGHYQEGLVALDQRAQIVPEQNDLLVMRGYAYLNLGRRPDALRVFQSLAAIGNADGQKALADLISPPQY